MSWCWKWKPIWRKGLIAYNSDLWIMVLLSDWLSFGKEGRLKWTSKVKEVEEFWKLMDKEGGWKGGWGCWKLDNFHGRHMCIIPYRGWHSLFIKYLTWYLPKYQRRKINRKVAEAYLGFCLTSMIGLFPFKLLTFFGKYSSLDVWQGSAYTSAF